MKATLKGFGDDLDGTEVEIPDNINYYVSHRPTQPNLTSIEELTLIEDEFRKQFDELKLKPPKNSMPGIERELIIDYWRKAILSIIDKAVLGAKEDLIKRVDEEVIGDDPKLNFKVEDPHFECRRKLEDALSKHNQLMRNRLTQLTNLKGDTNE